jgi:EAL and modified HD-GYP domain-containing signal transduction protein
MDVFVARQPIFDARQHIFAYELLFRGGLTNAFPDIDGDTASSKVLSNSFLNIGIDKLTGGRKAFINFTRDLLLRQVPAMFPRDRIMVEVLETVEPESDVVEACRSMRGKGYELALDDFVLRDGMETLVEMASIIKIDFRAGPRERIRRMLTALNGNGVRFLAEKIETHEEFDAALEMGFSYFQGYFFSKPEIIRSRDVAPSRMNLLRIVGEANRPDVDIDQLETLISSDVAVSYKLLRYINSSFFCRMRTIETIRHAVVLLGLDETRKFLSLVAAAELAGTKPEALIRASILRAKLCELLGRRNGYGGAPSELFLLGLFSLMDAILDMEMGEVMASLPLSDRLTSALLGGEGELAGYLRAVECYEAGTWEECLEVGATHCLTLETMADDYLEAVSWADSLAC